MRLAVFTVSPKTEYFGVLCPITPAMGAQNMTRKGHIAVVMFHSTDSYARRCENHSLQPVKLLNPWLDGQNSVHNDKPKQNTEKTVEKNWKGLTSN
jgi:hypothetical protein